MRLSHLTDKSLLVEIKNLVANERRSTLSILFHLQEIDRRKLYSDVKCQSLFHYCVKELGYSESAAQRRIVSARLLKKIPELEVKIQSGDLTLTNIEQVTFFYKDTQDQKEALKVVEGLTRKECEQKLFERSGKDVPAKETKKRISDNKMQVAIILSDETIALMEKVKQLSGKNLDSDQLIQMAMKAAIEKIEKEKFKQTAGRKSPPLAEVKRYVQAFVKREAYKRDQKCVNCGSIHNLNFDHRMAYALGGTSGIENIRMLCSNCNQRARVRAKL